MADLRVTVAGLELRNPVLAGSCEATATAEQIRACLDAGAGAVVAKSTNESEAAKAQLRAAEYVLLDEELEARPLGPASRTDSLFCRSGLLDEPFDTWVETLAELDRGAGDAYVVPSLIVADLDEALRLADAFQRAGLRWLELNVAAAHAGQAPAGAIRTGAELVRPVRETVSLPLSVKVGSVEQAEAALAAGADAVVLATRAQGFVPDLATRRPVLGTFAAVGGAWAVPLTCRQLAEARLRLGPAACLVGTNGARDGHDVARFLLAGASAAQLASAVVTDGPAALTRAIDQFSAYLDEQGLAARELVGEAADHVQTYEEVALERRH
ncbi:MAG: dihydroorotate dehydrogenase catalytic subunit [Actinomycetota bacterium]